MPRTVDPERHAERRGAIVDAAFTCFAANGYGATTTAAISRTAGIGSGTFFHYFPTKISVLLAILKGGTAETEAWFQAQEGRDEAYDVVLDWVRHTVSAAADPRMPGFVRAVGALAAHEDVAKALAADVDAQRSGLRPWVGLAQGGGTVRRDLAPALLSSWVMLVLDGYLARVASDEVFAARDQHEVLVDAVARLLAVDQPAAGEHQQSREAGPEQGPALN